MRRVPPGMKARPVPFRFPVASRFRAASGVPVRRPPACGPAVGDEER